ncbi:TonB-dependent receptor [Hymenobacter aerilatus]|uniref:TonB-dependent receptor n=1 Tax=Hymenobacter aerilatus TaxID=2932251 RepID=A0A8T9SXU9_9BACT|nr:TonB-dependent receptor [Hymenobacter aerilatus]UOR05553.1 TonB-dependent receptor [Hymenobacter aerilatus]
MRQTLLYSIVCASLLPAAAWAQTQTVTGRVTGPTGTALPGVTVLEKGTSNGTSTDADGRYRLAVPTSATLIFSAIGQTSQEIPLNGRSVLNASLQDASTDLNEVVVTGSRATEGRSNILTTAPVDVISAREIKAYGQTEVTQILSFIAPSFQSTRQTVTDGTDFVDPATLRGLGPDQVLVLVNGKRRHTSALVNINGTPGRGSVGIDMNVLPPAAIKRIEVLREGAAAQYGSDAIAGVINIQLKDDTTGVNVSGTAGQTTKGDGDVWQADANVGIGLKGRGYIDISGQVLQRGFLDRSGYDTAPLIYNGSGGNYASNLTEQQRRDLKAQDDAQVAARGFNRRNIIVGNSKSRTYSGFVNAAYSLVPRLGVEAYVAAGATQREGRSGALYRLPNQATQIDLTLYPDGFLPFVNSTVNDESLLVGVRGTVLGFATDLSNTYGRNSLRYDITNTLNASLPIGTSTQEFYAGTLIFQQNTTNLGFSRKFMNVGPLATLNVAFGGELRSDFFEIKAGEKGSYFNYGRLTAAGQNTSIGSQGFPGYRPSDATHRSRSNTAGYLDLESDLTDRLLVNLAGRLERYSDFGSNASGRVGARYSLVTGGQSNFINDLAVRGNLGNGFRAPSLQQRYFTNVATQFNQGQIQDVLTANNDNPIVREGFGIGALKQEKSKNYSAGLTARLARSFTLTVDAYLIDIRDRIVLSSQFSRSNPAVAAILANRPDVSSVQFFANAVNTRTKGLDVVLNERLTFGEHRLGLTAAANFNQTTVRGINSSATIDNNASLQNTLFDRQQRTRLEAGQPRSKINLSANYGYKIFNVDLRTVRFGEVKTADARIGSPADDPSFLYSTIDQTFSAKWVTDLVVSAQVLKWLGLQVGANNIFNVYPDKLYRNPRNYEDNYNTGSLSYTSSLDGTNRGRFLYSSNQFAFTGAYYFGRINVTF